MVSEWDKLFDELYLRTYAPGQSDEAAEREALAAVRLAKCPPGGDVLDAPCGYGRHSLALARAGYRVVGLDRSPVLLAEARRRAAETEWPRWVGGDYRSLPFSDRSFDVVLCLFTSLGYYGEEDDRQTLAEFARVLRPGGRLVVETMHRDRLVRIFQERSWDPLPDGAVVREERRFDPVRGVVEATHTLQPRSGEALSASYEARCYTATEFGRLVRDAGFGELSFYGDLEGNPLTTDTRLVVVAGAAT